MGWEAVLSIASIILGGGGLFGCASLAVKVSYARGQHDAKMEQISARMEAAERLGASHDQTLAARGERLSNLEATVMGLREAVNDLRATMNAGFLRMEAVFREAGGGNQNGRS